MTIKGQNSSYIINVVIQFIIAIKMPVALCIYLITTSVFSIIEDIIIKLLIMKNVIVI